VWVRVFLLVAVLSYSRRLLVKAFLSERQDDWREGLAAAFTHVGRVPRTLLGDNARALVAGRDRTTGTVIFQPAYLAFCRDWDVQPRACAPYRARTKGKGKAGVKYVNHKGLADRAFDAFADLEAHWGRGCTRPTPGSTGRRTRRRWSASSAMSGRPCGRCPRALSRGASSASGDGSPPMR
jgi:transposase